MLYSGCFRLASFVVVCCLRSIVAILDAQHQHHQDKSTQTPKNLPVQD